MFKQDYVRIKIGCRDVTKVSAVAEDVIDEYFHDFLFEREVPVDEAPPNETVAISNANAPPSVDLSERTPKKAKVCSSKV
uniref:Uncharacterized protein n=1 Tax=Arundo donax TaxID=35708 RepID=A0A0A9GQV9_ARUDO